MPQPTLLLLPGLMCDGAVWQHQIEHLGNEVNIIVPDLGHASTPEEMVTAALLSAPPSFMLAGHSMGGWVALEIMKAAPARVEKLCLANTTAKPDSKEKADARREMIALAEHGDYKTIVSRLSQAFVHQQQYAPIVKAILQRNQDALIPQEHAMLARGDCIDVLATIHCPTLVIHAAQDQVFSLTDATQLLDNIPTAELEIIDNAGHMSLIEQPVKFTELLHTWLHSKGANFASGRQV